VAIGNADFTSELPAVSGFVSSFGATAANRWLNQVHEIFPLYAFLKDAGQINRTPITFGEGSWKVSYPISYEDLDQMTEQTIEVGHSFGNRVTGDYIIPDKYTRAIYTVAKLGYSMTMTKDDNTIMAGPGGKSLAQEKEEAFQSRFNKILAEAMYSANTPTSKRLAGILHYGSASNTVGGISQTDNDWWQASVSSTAATMGRAFVLGIQNRYRRITDIDGKAMRLDVLAVANRSDSELYGALQEEFLDLVRITDNGLKDRYGLDNIVIEGTAIVADHQMPAANCWGFSKKCLEWVGDTGPAKLSPVRIPKTSDWDVYFEMQGQLACRRPAGISVYSNVSAA